MVQFRDKLKIASFYLDNTQCIAKYSFVVLKSVTYLDLSLCELSSFRGKRENVIYPNYISSRSTTVTSNFVCTEEGCKKSLAKNRKLLYDLHLDVSCGLELRFGNNKSNKDLRYHSDRVILNKVGIEGYRLEMRLDRMATNALARTEQDVKLLHRISKAAQRINFIGRYGYIRSRGSEILYSNCCDSNIVKDFLTAMNFEDGYLLRLRPEVVEYLLYHASCAGYRLRDDPPRAELINAAIYDMQFQYVPLLLQYRDTPKFCRSTYNQMTCLRHESFFATVPIKYHLSAPVENGLQTEERNFLILQIFYIFYYDRDSGLKALQLVWRSLSQAFISLDELIESYPELYGTKYLEEFQNYLWDINGEESFHPEPRKLKHYCRTAVRHALSINAKLFSGIDKINVPPTMLSFLKLEE